MNHLAVIMDGNGRWAKRRHLPRLMGHRAGAEALDRVMHYCRDAGIRYLTVYAFSTENWKRSKEEVSGLMKLLSHFIKSKEKELLDNGVRFRVIGRREDLSAKLQKEIAALEEKTKGGEFTLVVALSYGGRDEIVRAALKFLDRVKLGSDRVGLGSSSGIVGSDRVGLGSSSGVVGSDRVGVGSSSGVVGSDRVGVGSSSGVVGLDRVEVGSSSGIVGSDRVGVGSIDAKRRYLTLNDSKDPKTLEEVFSSCLDTADIPDPDLIVRTSGELRLSNFLLWQAAYAEFYFTDVLWPDFDKAEFDKALASFSKRDRRMGGR